MVVGISKKRHDKLDVVSAGINMILPYYKFEAWDNDTQKAIRSMILTAMSSMKPRAVEFLKSTLKGRIGAIAFQDGECVAFRYDDNVTVIKLADPIV